MDNSVRETLIKKAQAELQIPRDEIEDRIEIAEMLAALYAKSVEAVGFEATMLFFMTFTELRLIQECESSEHMDSILWKVNEICKSALQELRDPFNPC